MHPDQSSQRGFPWSDVMAFGLGILKLSPQEFWRLTLPELRALSGASVSQPNAALDREALDELMMNYPDLTHEKFEDYKSET